MRNIIQSMLPLLVVLLFWASCGAPTAEVWPEDLAGKKALLQTKKADIKTLNADVEKLIAEINTLEPKVEKTRKLVTVRPVIVEDFKRFLEIQSSIQSDDVVMATSETGGRLTAVTVKEGNYISKGKVIATVDMEQVNKQIAELETSLDLAIELYDRQKRLWDQNIGSEVQFLQAKNGKERLEKSLETVKFQLTKANVYAPISGVVDQVFLKTGELAGPGMPIVQILNTSKVKVVANVPEVYLKAVKRGDMVRISIPALQEERKGKVSLLGTSINPDNRTFSVEVNLNNKGGLLKPNLLANMYISDFEQKDAVLVPLEMVQQEVGGKSYVFVQQQGDNGDFAKKIYVQTGESYEGNVIVTEGLKGGENLIVDGARGLTENELIKVDNNTTKNNG